MMTLFMYLVNKNPTGGPIWFGAMCDIVVIVAIIVAIYEHKHGR